MTTENKPKRGGRQDPIDLGYLIPRVAALLIAGKSTTQIADNLQCSFNTVRRIREMDATKSLIRDMRDSATAVAVASIKKGISEMVELALEVHLEKLKKDRELDAVKLVYKVAGALADEPEKKSEGNQSLTIVMPGAAVEQNKVIEVQDVGTEEPEIQVRPAEEDSNDLQ